MRKILSLLVVAFLFSSSVVPMADALGIRIRKNRASDYSFQNPNPTPISTQPVYYTPPSLSTPSTYTYYYSPNFQAGYTYSDYPTKGYYFYGVTPPPYSNIERGQYYFSPTYQQGYVYYYTPTPGYYYYLPKTPSAVNPWVQNPLNNQNNICVLMNGVYQCTANTPVATYGSYPGCSVADIVIGGQVWAGCNATDMNIGSSSRSGWFFAGDTQSSFVSNNGANSVLEWAGEQSRSKNWDIGPCAGGYRLPTQSDWVTLQSYARGNNSTIANILNLPLNAGYQGSRNSNGDVSLNARLSVSASYWTSSYYGQNPLLMRIGSTYAGYNTTGTEFGYVNNGYEWVRNDDGLQLINSTTGELANVRCIRK